MYSSCGLYSCSNILIREYSIGNDSKAETAKQLMDQGPAIHLQCFVISFIKDSFKTGLLCDIYSYDSGFYAPLLVVTVHFA